MLLTTVLPLDLSCPALMCLCVWCSRVMWRNILTQSSFQLAITLFLVYGGESAFDITRGYLDDNSFGSTSVQDYLGTFVFNTFVFMQVGRPHCECVCVCVCVCVGVWVCGCVGVFADVCM